MSLRGSGRFRAAGVELPSSLVGHGSRETGEEAAISPQQLEALRVPGYAE